MNGQFASAVIRMLRTELASASFTLLILAALICGSRPAEAQTVNPSCIAYGPQTMSADIHSGHYAVSGTVTNICGMCAKYQVALNLNGEDHPQMLARQLQPRQTINDRVSFDWNTSLPVTAYAHAIGVVGCGSGPVIPPRLPPYDSYNFYPLDTDGCKAYTSPPTSYGNNAGFSVDTASCSGTLTISARFTGTAQFINNSHSFVRINIFDESPGHAPGDTNLCKPPQPFQDTNFHQYFDVKCVLSTQLMPPHKSSKYLVHYETNDIKDMPIMRIAVSYAPKP